LETFYGNIIPTVANIIDEHGNIVSKASQK